MEELIIRKMSDRRTALAQMRAYQVARRTLMLKQQEDPSLKLQDEIRATEDRVDMFAKAIKQFDLNRNLPPTDKSGTSLIDGLDSLPAHLIQLRLRKRISLRALGKRTGMKESVLSEYERTTYQKVSLRRLKIIVAVLENWGT